MEIKISVKEKGTMPEVLKVGDWIDLYTTEETKLFVPHARTLHRKKEDDQTERMRDVIFAYTLLDLGVAVQLPDGYEAVLVPRSSTFRKYGVIQTNGIGIIDGSYCGNNDVWKMPVLATRSTVIPQGTPIAQFRIQLSQKATIWQKLKWLFSSKITLKQVDSLSNEDRGGFGTGSDKYRTK